MTFRHLLHTRDFAAILLAVVVAVGGIAAWHAFPGENGEEDEETAEFRDSIKAQSKTIDAMIADTKAGKNVSEFRLGMFSMNLLNQLSDRDAGLGVYFHKDGRMMQSYLTDVFQYHSGEEISHVASMVEAAKNGTAAGAVSADADKAEPPRPAVRLSAQDALESLRHIPEARDSPEEQAQARKALIEALTSLNTDLAKAAKE